MTQEEITEAMIQGINRFLFCNWNFESVTYDLNVSGNVHHVVVPRVIVEAEWNCNVSHMINKWFEATKSGNPDAYFPRFYAELSSDNRRTFLTWIVNHYKGGQKL